MLGQMMSMPLSIAGLIDHAARCHGDTEIVSRPAPGVTFRYGYRDARARALRLANALATLGVQPGDRVGTLAWNTHRHLEAYFAVSGMGAVINTVNPRLFPEQVEYIVNHADNRVMLFDLTFLPLVEKIAPRCPGVRAWVALCDAAQLPQCALPLLCYETLLADAAPDFAWPAQDENTAASLCYTSGTTGNPKGVLYSHRSTVLHALSLALPDAFGLSASEVLMPVTPMFHVFGWGTPYAACITGVKLVLPGAQLDGASVYGLFEQEGVTVSSGVPTVWLGLLQYVDANRLAFSTMKRTAIGGSACPPAMFDRFAELGVEVVHAWGMTETSPLATTARLKAKHRALPAAEQRKLRLKQGRPLYGVEVRITGGDGGALPHDGVAFGDLWVRGPWVTSGYYRAEGPGVCVDGWFPTGDVATVDADGYVQITDRSKDVIKSGGEWISSIDIENLAVGHPAVAEAAVIGVAHEKWAERPLLVVVKKPGQDVDRAALLAFLEGKIAKWWMPDDVIFVEGLPHTATGKLSKLQLRQQLKDYRLPSG